MTSAEGITWIRRHSGHLHAFRGFGRVGESSLCGIELTVRGRWARHWRWPDPDKCSACVSAVETVGGDR